MMEDIIKAYDKRKAQLDEVINNIDKAYTYAKDLNSRYVIVSMSKLREDIENIMYPLIDDIQLIIAEGIKNEN